jgi:DNA-binding NarL/FixJ family response regulator
MIREWLRKWLNIKTNELLLLEQKQEIENLKLLMISPSTIAEISHDIENLKMVQTELKFIVNSYAEDFLKINMQSTQQIQEIKKDVEEQKTTISGISILQEEIQKQLVENTHSMTKDLSVFKKRQIEEWNGLDIRLEGIQSQLDTLMDRYTEISKRHSNSIKEGLEKAKKQGKVLGAPKKITPAIIKEVKKLLASGISHRDIREKLNISIGSISKIKKEN